MNVENLAMSRPIGVAEALRGNPLDVDVVLRSPVLLTGETDVMKSKNGQWCFENALRLLARTAGTLHIALPPGLGPYEERIRALAKSVYSQGSLTLIESQNLQADRFVAILNVGSSAHPKLPWTSVNSNGWLVRIDSNGHAIASDVSDANPIGAMMAASLGVAEIFKRIYGIPLNKGPLLNRVEFSLFDFGHENSSCGPSLPHELVLPATVLVGAGAIGNGICLLLGHLECHGRIHVVDYQNFAKENLGTCVLLDDPNWIGESKARSLVSWLELNSSLAATGEQSKIEEAREGQVIQEIAPELLLAGLDDIQARHDAQMLWPSVVVDGGINAIGAAVVTHRLDRPGACLRCSFELASRNLSAMQAEASGLAIESLRDQDQPLTEKDIELADEAKRPWLRQMLAQGKTRCATVGSAVAAHLGISLESEFRPSVPFVATAAAALVMAQAVKSIFFPEAAFTQRFQIESVFRGPVASVSVFQAADSRCICTTARDVIDLQAANRRTSNIVKNGDSN